MRRVTVFLAWLGLFCACCSQASAYSAPSGLTPSALCPSWPSDAGAASAFQIDAWGGVTVSGWTAQDEPSSSGLAWAGGNLELNAEMSSGSGGEAIVDWQDGSGAWHIVALMPFGGTTDVVENMEVAVPAGQVKLEFDSGSTSTLYGGLSGAGEREADAEVQQGLDAVCDAEAAGSAQAHTDAQAIASDVAPLDGDLSSLKAAVNGLSANGTTLDTLNGDLASVNAELVQIDTDVKAGGSGGSSGDPVELGTATMAAVNGDFESEHQDLWAIVGAIVGAFLLAEVLRRIWP